MAATKLLKFVERTQAYPAKRSADERTHDFLEISRPYILAKAEEQAGRCSQCGVPFCQVHCPLQNNIPDWLKLTAEGRLQEAYEVSAATNAMPEICGRICPQDRLCEGNCVIEPGFGSVTIGSVEKFLTDNAWEQGWVKPLQPVADRSGQSVAIIGAGPAGLTAAEALRVKGYDVHVFDRHDRAGGLLTYGIPGFKLEKPVVMRRVERLREGGVHFHQDFAVGRDASLADLRAKHAAVLIATGVYKARQVEVPGADGPTTMEALDYLIAANKTGFGDALPDAVEFVWLAAPAEITPAGVVAQGMRLGQPGPDGRRSPEPDADNRFTLQADLVIKALGFDAEDLPTLFGAPQLPVTRWGTVRIDHKTMMTGVNGVFAAGDIVRGASLVVWAVRDGRDVAAQMHQYLRARVTAAAAAA